MNYARDGLDNKAAAGRGQAAARGDVIGSASTWARGRRKDRPTGAAMAAGAGDGDDVADGADQAMRDGGAAVEPQPRVTALALIGLGVAAALAAGALLWSSEGGAVFLAQAFAALAACF